MIFPIPSVAGPTASARFFCGGRERGAVLIVGLVMLAVMTLLVVSMIKTSVVELKIGGVTQIAQQNMTNAERMINTFIDVNNGRFAANYLPLPTASGGPQAPGGAASSYEPIRGTYSVVPTLLHHGQANLEVREIHCAPDPSAIGISIGAVNFVHFDIRSTATGTLGGTSSVHQGIKSTVPAGSCP